MSKLEAKISKEYDNVVIREYLKENMELSTRLIRSAAIDKRILVNNIPVRMRYKLKEGDELIINLQKKESQRMELQNIPIDIIYEDSEILVINKPPYMVVHPTKNHKNGTLANGILYYFKESRQECIVRLVSRLDMNTDRKSTRLNSSH